jgi:dTDP-4-dehydrorhamnose reductase
MRQSSQDTAGMAAAVHKGMTLPILLVGRNGQVGQQLEPLLSRIGRVAATDRQQLDLARPDEIRRTIRDVQPRIIVNAAAYTAVDKAESDEAAAQAINAEAPGVMAEEAARIGALMVHYSTDYVFDGTKAAPYVENDPPNPQNVYGKTKLAGERAVQAAGAAHLIFRTAWVYGREGRNFMLTILRLASQKEELRIVNDQFGSPTWSHEIASATVSVLTNLSARPGGLASAGERSGIYHLTAAGETDWSTFAEAILEEASARSAKQPWFEVVTGGKALIARRVVPILTSEYPTPAKRPRYSVLSNARLKQTFGVSLPDWRAQLRSVFARTSAASTVGLNP